jgi:L-ascorbate metabolism protein UlaG (beta-lactamase superfamily)
MKRIIPAFILASILMIFSAGCSAPAAPTATPEPTATSIPPTPTPSLQDFVARFHWFGISSILYRGSKNIYFDPVSVFGDPPTADLVLISHGHDDHADVTSLVRIITPNTKLIISPNVTSFYERNKALIGVPALVLAEGEATEVDGVQITAVPAFDLGYHLRETGGVGFVVTIDGKRIYFAGGTNYYPEMANIESDVAFYPIYTKKDVDKAVEILPTKVIIFVHSTTIGSKSFADLYSQSNSKIEFVTLESGPYLP